MTTNRTAKAEGIIEGIILNVTDRKCFFHGVRLTGDNGTCPACPPPADCK